MSRKVQQKTPPSQGIRLLKKGQRGIVKLIFSRMGMVLLLLVLNLGMLFAAFMWFEEFLPHVYGGTALFTIGMVLFLVNSRIDPTAKITWLVLITLMPVFGSLLYLFTRADVGHRAMHKRLNRIYEAYRPPEAASSQEEALAQTDRGAYAMTTYVRSVTGIPLSCDTDVIYFPDGRQMWERMLTELEQANTSIYLEYFIIDEGLMWGQVLEVLAKKAAQGVDVRVMYDGACELLLLPKGYPKRLKKLGIQCRVFSPATPFLSTHYNYRDHRKILTIDGKVAFTGGVNLADEYINEKPMFGHWKDTAVMLTGSAARQFAHMFLQIWYLYDKHPTFEQVPLSEPTGETMGKGFVLPYYDDPLDREHVARQVYVDILARAQHYVHIMTPYLILDGELENALTYAAKRGVDVTLLLPGIPDKKLPYALAKSHYAALIEAGVKICEYTPGFVHAKVVVSDDREAVVGSVNFDYRSLYHHFECAVYLHSVSCIAEIEADFQATIEQARLVTSETMKQEKLFYKVAGRLMKMIAPLM